MGDISGLWSMLVKQAQVGAAKPRERRMAQSGKRAPLYLPFHLKPPTSTMPLLPRRAGQPFKEPTTNSIRPT